MSEPAATLIASWSANAELWTRAVRERAIASRREVTDAAILAAVRRTRPHKLLDVGCGEGWLCRALADTGAKIMGVDASPQLIAAATAAGGGTFVQLDYAGLAAQAGSLGAGFDTLVCNFSLLDDRTGDLLAALAHLATDDARLIVQTVHPAGIDASTDGWRSEDFATFGDEGWTAMPWYFRSLASWREIVATHWRIETIEEPRTDGAARPSSLLITARRTKFYGQAEPLAARAT